MKKKFTFLTAAFMLLAFLAVPLGMRGQSDYSTDYAGNVTLSTTGGTSASACKVVINSIQYDGVKAGTGSAFGAMKIAVPSGTKYLHLHVAAWNGDNSSSLSVTPNGYSDNIALTSNSGISGNSPFTFNGNPSTTDYYKVITFSTALTQSTELTFTATGGKRFVIWGVTAEEDGGSQTETHTLTFAANPAVGGTVSVYGNTTGTITLEENATVSISATPAELGYAFNNWTYSGTGASVDNTSNASTTFTMGTSDATLTANFSTVTTYTVTYKANGPEEDDIVDTYNEGATVTLRPANTFSYSGHTFTEWKTVASGDGTSYNPGDEISNINANLVLFAQWEESNERTATLNIQSYAAAHSWQNDTRYPTATVDQVTFTASDGTNTGKYYTTGNQWRYYQNENATITISVTNGYHLVSITPTYASQNGGVLLNGETPITTGSAVSVSGTSVTFSVDNSGSATNGQVRFTNIVVIYESEGSTLHDSDLTITNASTDLTFDLYNNATAQVINYTTSSTGTITITPASPTSYFSYVHDAVNKTITVTPEAVTPSAQTVTISQEADDDYYAGQATFTVFVANSNPNAPGTVNNPYTVAEAIAATPASGTTDTVYIQGIVSSFYNTNGIMGDGENFRYRISDDGTTTTQLLVYRGKGLNNEAFSNNNDLLVGDEVVICGKLTTFSNASEIASGNFLYSWNRPGSAEPSITVTPSTINAPAEGATGTLALAYENIEDFAGFDYYFCNAEGEALEEDPDWITVEINEENDTYTLVYLIEANDGEARTEYFKVWAYDDEFEEVSAIVTVNQAEYVAPTYAELPFAFDSGKAAIENTDGLYQEGLGSDYGSSPYLKLDGEGDYVLLQFDERPGTLEFDVKGNGSGSDPWAGVFKVMVSDNGSTFVEKAVYETGDLTSTKTTITIDDLASDVRYIKWIYTTKTKGNVALGNINLHKYEAPEPAITLNSYSIEATAAETEGTLTVTYTEIDTDLDPEIYWFESDGETSASEPDWMTASINDQLNVEYLIEENEGAARTAYFKVYGIGTDESDVYSDLVTVSQAAAPQQYTLTVESFENLELITFVNDEMVLEAAGTINVNEGDQIMLSVVADEGYVMETLLVNEEDHVNDIESDFTYTFDMPAENVTISATAVEYVAPAGGDYVRITSLDWLTDGSKVIIAARFDEDHPNGYYAMENTTSGKPTGVAFTSETSETSGNEILPATITASEDSYSWTVEVTDDSYTFTNAGGQMIAYNSGTNFATGGDNTAWTITRETAEDIAMVAEYTGFVIRNGNTDTRAFAFNGTAFGAYATSNMTNTNNAPGYNFCLDFFAQVEDETVTLNIDGYDDGSDGGYYLIASPVAVDLANVEGMTDGDFDLYYFDQAQDLEWQNYKAHGFGLVPGKGYLYAKKAVNEDPYSFTFTGTPYTGDGVITLDYTEDNQLAGWNLIGNPFATAAALSQPYFRLNADGNKLNTETEDSNVAVMEGVFVQATAAGQTAVFTAQSRGGKQAIAKANLQVVGNNGTVIDNAIVRFDNGQTLEKYIFGNPAANIYFAQDGKEYAIVRSEAQGEMPVNFKAAENGTYTISVEVENLSVEYLHLIDNMTGANIDLLATPSYTFEARKNDYASRFRLVFNANAGNSEVDDDFAFVSDGNIVISNEGEATLQVIDMLGRVISTQIVNGSASIENIGVSGVYVLRLVNGNNVKTQRIVVR